MSKWSWKYYLFAYIIDEKRRVFNLIYKFSLLDHKITGTRYPSPLNSTS